MSDHHTYKKIENVGSSKVSIEDAIENALAECAKSVRNLDWFEVVETDFEGFRSMAATMTLAMALTVAVGEFRRAGKKRNLHSE